MATDPSTLINYLATQVGPGISNAFQQGQNTAIDQANALQQNGLNSLKLQGLQRDQQRQASFDQAAQTYLSNPTPQALSELAVRFPEHADEMKNAWKIKDDAQKQSDLGFYSSLYSASDNNRSDLVKATIQNRRDAMAKAGMDTSELDDALAHLSSGADVGDALKEVKGLALAHINASDPAKFNEAFGLGKDKTHVITAGGALVDDTGKELYKAAEKPERPIEVPVYDDNGRRIGTRLVPLSPSSSPASSAAGGRTTGGWTPRERNGGDNSDAAVDSKIIGVAKILGVDPDADISTLSPRQIAQALSFGEGGSGSLADRNNNPTNIRNGDGGYKKFASTDSAYNAASALVANKLRKGQTSVRTLIEGLPASGGSADPGYYGPQGGDGGAAKIVSGDITTVPASIRSSVQAIADGRSAPPRPGSRNGEALLDAVTAYDPTFDAANATSRVKTRVDFTSGKSAQNITAMNTAMGHLIHLDDMAHDLDNFSTMPGLINPIYNSIRSAAGNTKLGAFEQTKQAASSELRKVFAGSNGGNLEELKQFESNLSSSKSYDQLHAVIQNAVQLLGSRLSSVEDQYTQGMGRSDQIPTFIKPSIIKQAQQRFGVDLSSGHAGGAADTGGIPAGAQPTGKFYQGKPVYIVNGKKWVP